jgi:hypothetical protein
MPKMNLSYVLGPSIVGNSANNISSVQIIHEIKIQHQIVENLISLPFQYYENIMSINDAKLLKNAPNTPEILRKSRTATVLSSLLGPAINNNNNNNPVQPLQQRQNTLDTAPSSANRVRRNNNYNQK